MTKLILASLGTDHHQFNRLVDWLDAVAVRYPDCKVIVQHGHSGAPGIATGHNFMPYDMLIDLMRSADLVVCHGGPGTIMDAHKAGHVPLMVPRDPALGEHVDGHQLRFASAIADSGRARVATDIAAFDAEVDRALSDTKPEIFIPRQRAPQEPMGMPLLAAELDGMPVQVRRLTPLMRSVRRVIQR